uniref:DUF38 domain-containing protein n=1 Tax=Panagrolaimus davidi TaxID=227884 RepID=A0A914R4Q6_9BILA
MKQKRIIPETSLRFFIDDIEMKNEYKEACKIYGPSIVSWKNLFDFEKFKEEEIDNEIFVNDPVELVLYTDTSECIKPEPNLTDNQKISTLNYKNQEFSLPKTIIFYMIENSKNSNILQKLHQCCKYFFVKFPYPVCYNVEIRQETCNNNVYKTININYTEFIKNSATIFYNPPFPDLVFGRKFIISNTFHYHHPDKLILSTFLSNIFQCNAKHLRISYQDFTLKEFKFLVGHGNVEILSLREANPVNDKNEAVELQEILHLTPKIIEFEIKKPKVTEETFKTLNQMNFENKFQHLILRSMTLLEPLEFAEFLKKNLGINSVFLPHFNGNHDSLEYKCAINILKNELKNYWPENGRPEIYDQYW